LVIFLKTDNATSADNQPVQRSGNNNINIGLEQLSDSHDSDLQKHSLVDDDIDDDTTSDMDESIDTDDIALEIIDSTTNDAVTKTSHANSANTGNTGNDSDHAEDGLAIIEHKVIHIVMLS
jgi:hypothetical protein